MNKNLKTSSLTEAAVITGILVVMSLISYFLVPFFEFMFPVPAIILAKRRGYQFSAMALISASLVNMMFLGIPIGIMYLIIYTPVGIAMSYTISKDWKASRVIALSSVVVIISSIIAIYLIQIIFNIGIAEEIRKTVDEVIRIQTDMMTSLKFEKVQIDLMIDIIKESGNLTVLLLPAFLISVAFAFVAANYYITMIVVSKLKIDMVKVKDFCYFYLSVSVVLGFVVLLAVTYILKDTNIEVMDIIYKNIFFLGRIMFLIQGLAIVKFFSLKKGMGGFVRFIVFLLILLIYIVQSAVIIISALDCLFDFRKVRRKDGGE